MTALAVTGGIISILGLGVAAIGVRSTRIHYSDQPGIVGRSKDLMIAFLRGLGLRPPVSVTVEAKTATATATANTLASALKEPGPGTSLDGRVNILVGLVTELQKQANALLEDLRRESSQRKQDIAELYSALRDQQELNHSEIRSAMASGLSLATFGLFLAVLGTLLSTLGSAVQ